MGSSEGEKEEKGRYGRKGSNKKEKREGSSGKILLKLTEIVNINELQQRKSIATTVAVHDSQNSDVEVDLSPVYFWGAVGSGAVCLQSCAESGGPAL